jgi:hypothetical protein
MHTPQYARGSRSWNEYANCFGPEDTVEDLLELRANFRAYRREKHIEGEDMAVAYTDMQLTIIGEALAARGVS